MPRSRPGSKNQVAVKCPHGLKFGIDVESKPFCATCKVFEDCAIEEEKLIKAKRPGLSKELIAKARRKEARSKEWLAVREYLLKQAPSFAKEVAPIVAFWKGIKYTPYLEMEVYQELHHLISNLTNDPGSCHSNGLRAGWSIDPDGMTEGHIGLEIIAPKYYGGLAPA